MTSARVRCSSSSNADAGAVREVRFRSAFAQLHRLPCLPPHPFVARSRCTPHAGRMTEPVTRFEFESYDALYAELLDPLEQAGWHTFDAN